MIICLILCWNVEMQPVEGGMCPVYDGLSASLSQMSFNYNLENNCVWMRKIFCPTWDHLGEICKYVNLRAEANAIIDCHNNNYY